MTVQKWRRKHRRCKFCKHIRYMNMPLNCNGADTWCAAKMKIVNDELPRFFCLVYEVKEATHDDAGRSD